MLMTLSRSPYDPHLHSELNLRTGSDSTATSERILPSTNISPASAMRLLTSAGEGM